MDIHNSDSFSKPFDYASGKTGERFQNPLWQVTEFFFGKHFKESVAEVKAFGDVIVKNAVESRQIKRLMDEKSIASDQTFDLLTGSLINSLLDTVDDHQVVADAALNYLSAGEPPDLATFQIVSDACRTRYHCPSIDLDLLSAYA